jgi:penicillin-binding protein 1C
VRYREALANSYNISAVKVLQRVGVATLLGFMRDAGISSLTDTADHYGLALTLGDAEVSLLDLTKAYAIFPRGGLTLDIRSTESDPVSPGRQILDPKIAWLISDILSDNSARLPEFGDDSPLKFPFPVAAKTGTTRNSRDNWTMGYTPDLLVGVWVGNADNSPMQGTSGITGAGPIFHDVMLAATRFSPPHAFVMPAGITRLSICTLSGKLPTPDCPNTMMESFIAGTEPTQRDDIFHSIALDARNGLLASSACPSRYVTQKVFAIFPPDTAKWARENRWPQPPTTFSPLCEGTSTAPANSPPSQHWLEITSPHVGDSFQLDPLIPPSRQQVILEASAGSDVRTVQWYVDGQKIAEGTAPDFHATWMPRIGRFTIQASAGDLVRKVTIEVVKAEEQ